MQMLSDRLDEGGRKQTFALFSVMCLAVTVSWGVALVSLSKVLVLSAVLIKLWFIWRSGRLKIRWQMPEVWAVTAVFAALFWMMLSLLWTDAPGKEGWTGLSRHARFLVLPAVYFLLDTRADVCKVLWAIVGGQLFVLASSWLMWLGVPVPWAVTSDRLELGVVFTSTLEQPVMSTLMLAVVWFMRNEIPKVLRTWVVTTVLILTVFNVFFVMTGRSGYLVMLVLLTLMGFWAMPKRWRWATVMLPVLLTLTVGATSTRFQQRIMEVKRDVVEYKNGSALDSTRNSQGIRLDYWFKSLEAAAERPLLGHGVGSWRSNYIRLGGAHTDNPPSNPHQQFLLWLVEGGGIGFVLLCSIFFAIYRDATRLAMAESQTLMATLAIAITVNLMNCALFGAGIGEFFFVLMAALLVSNSVAVRNEQLRS